MQASLSFSSIVLRPEFALEGKLVVKNLGNNEGSQFQIELKGLPQDCYLIDPFPRLYPGAQEEIRLRLFHHSTYPDAGRRTLYIIVTAPESYPGEEISIQQNIYVAPVFDQKLELLDDMANQAGYKKEEPARAAEVPAGSPSSPSGTTHIDTELVPSLSGQSEETPTPHTDQSPLAVIETLEEEPLETTPEDPSSAVNPMGTEAPLEIEEAVDTQPAAPNPPAPVSVQPALPVLSAPKPIIKVAPPLIEEEEMQEKPAPQPQIPVLSIDRSKLKVVKNPSKDFWNED
jgi:hypothetical protein